MLAGKHVLRGTTVAGVGFKSSTLLLWLEAWSATLGDPLAVGSLGRRFSQGDAVPLSYRDSTGLPSPTQSSLLTNSPICRLLITQELHRKRPALFTSESAY